MTTLKDRPVWDRYLATRAALGAHRGSVRAALRATASAKRGQPVYAVRARDFYAQLADDYRAAGEMADSVNHALGVDRDRAVDDVLRVLDELGEVSAAEELDAVAHALEVRALRAFETETRILASLLVALADAARTSLDGGVSP